ncbi:Mechanosensitive ion channel-domain-containing protein [Flagelloscypha sp. PMI_526]|nr:Mechanosensitive ion channel-domain-containing protein [Flagelloscypha sp. PMI_526]
MSLFGRKEFKYQQGATGSATELPYHAPQQVSFQKRGQSEDTIEMSSYSKPQTGGPSRPEAHSRNSQAPEDHLAFAEGDIPDNKAARFYHYLLNASVLTRWVLFILPVMGIIWIPAILQLTGVAPHARVWGVPLLWWSVWLSVVWGGWWACLAGSRLLPSVVRHTVGVVAVASRRYIDWLGALHRYANQTGSTEANAHPDQPQTSAKSVAAINFIGKLLFGIMLCAALLLFEKFAIQYIAGKFHERSYAERIADQKFAVRSLVVLYRHSHDTGRSDTLTPEQVIKDIADPKKLFRHIFKGARNIATTTTTALGNVASEIAGTSVLQPNSPAAMVQTALESANKSRLLARRIFYSFVQPGSDYLFVEDIARYFSDAETADKVYALFDRDTNGDASREEVEMACADLHREQLSLEHSMQDLDSAVGRLDNILMSLYVVIAALIIAVALEAEVATLVTSAGTLVLGLSWLIGTSLSEVLISIIFLFVKHPFDVGDRVDVDTDSYTVKEIRLLSTIFIDSRGVLIQAPNVVLNDKFIQNIRRSPQISEPFTFDVAYGTSFADLENLRNKMMAFLESERRDFLTVFDVTVLDYPNQESMTLSADIKYKSNSQQSGLKARRRNKWLCALKRALAECEIYGPAGNPDAKAPPKQYTEVPWSIVKEEEERKMAELQAVPMTATSANFNLRDKNTAIIGDADDVFGDTEELRLTNPRRNLSQQRPGQASHPRAQDAVMPPPSAYLAQQQLQHLNDHS